MSISRAKAPPTGTAVPMFVPSGSSVGSNSCSSIFACAIPPKCLDTHKVRTEVRAAFAGLPPSDRVLFLENGAVYASEVDNVQLATYEDVAGAVLSDDVDVHKLLRSFVEIRERHKAPKQRAIALKNMLKELSSSATFSFVVYDGLVTRAFAGSTAGSAPLAFGHASDGTLLITASKPGVRLPSSIADLPGSYNLAHLPAGRFVYGHRFLEPFEFTAFWQSASTSRAGTRVQVFDSPASKEHAPMVPKRTWTQARNYRWKSQGNKSDTVSSWRKSEPEEQTRSTEVAPKRSTTQQTRELSSDAQRWRPKSSESWDQRPETPIPTPSCPVSEDTVTKLSIEAEEAPLVAACKEATSTPKSKPENALTNPTATSSLILVALANNVLSAKVPRTLRRKRVRVQAREGLIPVKGLTKGASTWSPADMHLDLGLPFPLTIRQEAAVLTPAAQMGICEVSMLEDEEQAAGWAVGGSSPAPRIPRTKSMPILTKAGAMPAVQTAVGSIACAAMPALAAALASSSPKRSPGAAPRALRSAPGGGANNAGLTRSSSSTRLNTQGMRARASGSIF